MNLDTRARRAADGLRASTGGVDPMAQITELKHEDQSRRRASRTAAVLGGVIVVAGAGWLAASQLAGSEDSQPQPMSSPDVVVTEPAPELSPGPVVGAELPVPLRARAPAEWTVSSDAGYVWLDADSWPYGASVQIGGPVEKVWDYDADRAVGVSLGGCFQLQACDSYADYLLGHPSLVLLGQREVSVDGREFDQLTFRVKDDAPSTPGYDGVILARYAGIDTGQAWSEVEQGSVFTEAVLELPPRKADHPTMVVAAVGATGAEETAEQQAGLDLVLSTMKLPN